MDKIPSTRIGDAATNDAVFYFLGRIDHSQAGAIWSRLARNFGSYQIAAHFKHNQYLI
jgi:hypothetical protein